MRKGTLEYDIIDECKCGPEEFFVLVSSVEFGCNDELDSFLKILVLLVKRGLLQCDRVHGESNINISLEELQAYVQQRIDAGESLDEYPSVCKEYTFTTTEKGIECLQKSDRPIEK